MNIARKQILRQVEQRVVSSAKPKLLHLNKRTITHNSSSSSSSHGNNKQATHNKHGEHYQEKGNTAIFSEVVDKLWQNYKLRVPDAEKYSNLVESQGGSFAFDHIAFRTLNLREKESGIELFKRILEPFGYQECSSHPFPQHNLTAVHFEMKPSETELAHIYPKILVTQLEVEDLPKNTQNLVKDTVLHHTGAFGSHERTMLDKTTLDILDIMRYSGRHLKFVEKEYIFSNLVHLFHYVPWGMISKDALDSVSSVSKYAAWCLLFGYHPHHFSALVNSQRVTTMNTIENTIETCKKVGLKFGGTAATKDILKQASTETVQLPVGVSVMKGDEEHISIVKWPYSYFEIIERGTIYDQLGRPQGYYGGFVEDNTLSFICNPENIPIEKRDLQPSHQKHQMRRPHRPAILPFI